MAVLTSTGIIFGDGTSMNSKYDIYPQSCVALFFQANAPIGWTRSTAHNDKALRVVSGTGGGSGGAIGFLSAFPTSLRNFSGGVSASGSVGATTVAWPQMPSHGHANGSFNRANNNGFKCPGPLGCPPTIRATETGTTGAGGNGAHAHPWSGSGSFSISTDFRCLYVDVIACSFN